MELILKCNNKNFDLFLGHKNNLISQPTEHGASIGCKQSTFGTREYVALLMNNWKISNPEWNAFTEKGLEHFNGLYERVIIRYGKVDRIGLEFYRW